MLGVHGGLMPLPHPPWMAPGSMKVDSSCCIVGSGHGEVEKRKGQTELTGCQLMWLDYGVNQGIWEPRTWHAICS